MAVPQNISRRTVASLLGRSQGPELFISLPFVPLDSPILPRNFNLTRPLESFKIVWRGRIVIANNDLAPVAAEAPQTLLQRIRITGTHRAFNQLVPLDISGATLHAFVRLFQARGSTLLINGVRQPELGVPLAQDGAVFGDMGTYDVEIHYDIPVGLMFSPANRAGTAAPYLWMQQDWADSIQIQLFFGDETSLGTPGAPGDVTFSAFGSGTGSPTVATYANYWILGPLATAFQTSVVVRNEITTVGGAVAAVANNQRIALLAKQRTANLIVKTGTILAGSSAGVQVFSALQDDALDRTVIVLDNKPVRNNPSNPLAKEFAGRAFNTVLPGGYLNFSFVDSQNPLTMYRGDLVPGGATFELDSDVLLAASGQAYSVLQEQVFGASRAK